jgi:hypothetical protein
LVTEEDFVADQVSGTVETGGGTSGVAVGPALGGVQHLEHNSGRPISWVGVTIAIVGAVIGGAGFIPHPTWWIFWTGAGVMAVGLLVLVGAKTFSTDWY